MIRKSVLKNIALPLLHANFAFTFVELSWIYRDKLLYHRCTPHLPVSFSRFMRQRHTNQESRHRKLAGSVQRSIYNAKSN